MKRFCTVIVAVVALTVGGSASADVVTAAVAVNGPTPIVNFEWENTIDQSGLTTGYVSGVTDFATYVGIAPTHIRNNDPPNFAASFTTAPTNIDYDLGASQLVTQLLLWNYPFGGSAGILNFEVYTANMADFSDGVLAGSFTASDDGDGDNNSMQVFNLTDLTGRYVRIATLTGGPNGTGLSEVAFGTVIPGPGALALIGLAGLMGTRRRRS